MGALAAGDNFHRLGPLRLEFMSLVLEARSFAARSETTNWDQHIFAG
jgi:hypothetical protein